MIDSVGTMIGGDVMVVTTEGRGFTPEELAENALDKIIYVGSNSHPAIRDQAEAFKQQIRSVLISYGRQCINSHGTTLANRFRDAGHPELIKLLEK